MAEKSRIRLKEIWVYPIKSLGGVQLQQAAITERGLQYDRRWMLLDEAGNFLTQRQHAQMALFTVQIKAGRLIISSDKSPEKSLSIPIQPLSYQQEIMAPIWDDRTLAWHVNDAYDHWFSQTLGISCRLVYMPEESERQVTGKYSGSRQATSFADDYPILLIGQESLDELNSRLPLAIPMNRFRPNLVTEGAKAFAEDCWHQFTVAGQPFSAEKPCARCIVTTIDQATATKSAEPLRTLATYRKNGNKVLFGQDILCPSSGSLQVGDPIEVLSEKPDPLHAS